MTENSKITIRSKDFRCAGPERRLHSAMADDGEPFCPSDVEYDDLLAKHVAELSSLQQLHYMHR